MFLCKRENPATILHSISKINCLGHVRSASQTWFLTKKMCSWPRYFLTTAWPMFTSKWTTSTVRSLAKRVSFASSFYFNSDVRDKAELQCSAPTLVFVSDHKGLLLPIFSQPQKSKIEYQVFEEYFKELEEESIRDNFVIIYELLDEMMDFGHPQSTDSNILKESCAHRHKLLYKKYNLPLPFTLCRSTLFKRATSSSRTTNKIGPLKPRQVWYEVNTYSPQKNSFGIIFDPDVGLVAAGRH